MAVIWLRLVEIWGGIVSNVDGGDNLGAVQRSYQFNDEDKTRQDKTRQDKTRQDKTTNFKSASFFSHKKSFWHIFEYFLATVHLLYWLFFNLLRPLHKPATISRHQFQTQLKTGIGVKEVKKVTELA